MSKLKKIAVRRSKTADRAVAALLKGIDAGKSMLTVRKASGFSLKEIQRTPSTSFSPAK